MIYNKLGDSGLKVSSICLGTMTWGEQNSEIQAFEQMDYAVSEGINFFDTAEMYPVPPLEKTQGDTERIIGNWLKQRKTRDKIIIATKITGKSEGFKHVRNGELPSFDRKNIEYALEQNLKRLQTEYIDLYQLHWPDRKTNYFGQLGYTHDDNDKFVSLMETLEVLKDMIKQGKIRHVGLSNETPWGALDALRAAEKYDLPKIVSVQNPYNLLNRSYEVGMAEISIRENCGLLAYSPLAFGMLSGKYLNGANPENTRLNMFARFTRYKGVKAFAATALYAEVAKKHGLSLAQMALAYVNSRRFVTSNIVGATTMEQLRENIGSIKVELSDEILQEIEKIHTDIPNPCP